MLLRLFTFFAIASSLSAELDSWELSPVLYSDSQAHDRVAKLAAEWSRNPEAILATYPLLRVREILKLLEVPEASQVLVFSKTSKQNHLISPNNPRALFFSMNCYIGYVPAGLLEVAIQDSVLGLVYYSIDLDNSKIAPQVTRNTSECLSCHATSRTEHVPGLLIRSVFPDMNGNPLLALGSALVTHQTPIPQRWGGYYVTGSVALPHLGNRTYLEAEETQPMRFDRKDLRSEIDTSSYLCTTSDIVALMVLEHQCQAHNLLLAASMDYKRAHYLSNAIHPEHDSETGSTARIADRAAEKIISWFLFTGEAEQGADGIEGNDEFQSQFQAMIPSAPSGDSLSDFHLNGHLFKNRCSYMIYSEAFNQLPIPIKNRVIMGLKKILTADRSDDDHAEIKIPERRRIFRILDETEIW